MRSQLALPASASRAAAPSGRTAGERVNPCPISTLNKHPANPQRLSTRCALRTRSSWCSMAASTCLKVGWDSNCLLHYGTNIGLRVERWPPPQHHCCFHAGANMPCSDRAVHHLEDNGVLFGPGKAANAGMGWLGPIRAVHGWLLFFACSKMSCVLQARQSRIGSAATALVHSALQAEWRSAGWRWFRTEWASTGPATR